MAATVHQSRLFFIALQFFTRIPIPGWVGYEPAWLQHASRYYPLVGLVVAAVTGSVYFLSALILPSAIAVLLSTIAGIYLTGAFHEDGFADVCDGFGGGYTRQRVLEIMKDSRVGAYGAIGIGLLLLLKCAILAHLQFQAVIAALFIAHPLSRLFSAVLIWRMEYARDEGKAKPLAQSMTAPEITIAAMTTLLPLAAIALGGWIPWPAILTGIAAGALATAWLARYFQRRIGGFTGDCLGAVQQLSEVGIYLGILAFIYSSTPH
ncbi:adenosylcobinamide-GDP ribazoletransferase [Pollutimonas subterranea]|uniref:Adenosylcobinamide-GDP ribazoletransferase n=1 Tax=Pollutimonas subterranea TaxID=2045210 RepID=A0A2N4U1L1_9BURK|nr:adenosylcobinamide-GDP ribazoletransferase [Pollutimonas subterranea]PLC48896.1 adenosylcobinamide-GDP ribazoletransferase [Pollutimonas subterranea]